MARLNTALLLSGRNPDVVDPQETEARGMSLRQMAQAQQMQDLQLGEARKGIERDNQIRSLYGMNLSPDQLQHEVMTVDPKTGMAMAAEQMRHREQAAKTGKAEHELDDLTKSDIAKRTWALYNAPPQDRPALWNVARSELLATGRFTPEQLGEDVPDDKTLRFLGMRFLDPDKQTKILHDIAAEARANEDQGFKRNTEQRTQDTFTAELPGKEAKSRAEQLGAFGQAIGAVEDQAGYDQLVSQFPEMGKFYGPMFSPSLKQRAVGAGMSANERATQAGSAESRAETKRANTAQESLTRRGQDLVDRRAHQSLMVQSGGQNASAEGKLRDDYRKESQTFVQVRDATQKILASAQSKTGAGDIALVYGFMKALDPGSTVREGEYANAANAGSVPDRWRSIYNNVLSGQKLPEPVRQQMVAEAKRTFGLAQQNQSRIDSYYKGISDRYKLNPQNVLSDYGSADSSVRGMAYQHTATGQNGHRIGSNDGKSWFDLETGQAVK